MKYLLFVLIVLLGCVTSFAFSHSANEEAKTSAVIMEVDAMGIPVPGAAQYLLTQYVHQQGGSHPTSFTLCTHEDGCEVFWSTKQREKIRCGGYRYFSAVMAGENGTTPMQLVVDEVKKDSRCEEDSFTAWEVRLISGSNVLKEFVGTPE